MAARKPLSVTDRRTIAVQMLAPDRPRGTPGELVEEYAISRQMTYYLAQQGQAALDAAFQAPMGPQPVAATLTVTPVRLKRAVTRLSLVGVSQRDTQLALTELLDTSRSLGYVAGVVAEAEQLAAAANAGLRPPLSGLVAADEVFLHDQPILGVVQPSSLYGLSLEAHAQRDGDTWGCTFLDQAADVAGVISDAGGGLAAGAQAAELPCHVGDWFHPLLLAAYVAAQYERRAYSALAQVYAREAQLHQPPTLKRWENHWRRYLTEVDAADTRIDRYDAWATLCQQLRATASQFDWETGAVRDPAAIQAALLALADACAPLAEGTHAHALGRLLRHQAAALTTALPLLATALAPLRAAGGATATQVVCRLWPALQEYACPAWPPAYRARLDQAITESLAWASAHLGAQLPALQHLVAAVLAQWPRTSSAVECLNSLLRPYLNGRKQVSQGFLDLFRFFHNTHRFVRGERAGHSPLELAGGPEIADPLAYLGLGSKA